MILAARYIAPVESPVIENGAIRFRDATVVAVGPSKEFDVGDEERVDFGNAVITPGFVNAHTHLELTHLAERVAPSPDFTGWLTRLVKTSSESLPTKESVQRIVTDGIFQSHRAGVTTVGDITRFPAWTRQALSNSMMRAVSFGEVIAVGTRRHLLQERLAAAMKTEFESELLRCGVSPHAPYTVEPNALRECARRSVEQLTPLCIHGAETLEESEFTCEGTGVFADYLRSLGVWDDDIPIAGLAPIPLFEASGLLTDRTVLAHANYVCDDDIHCIGENRASVAYCPRTHDAFEHPPHRFRDMLDAGVNVCIGTDSLASNPSLSILDELRFLHQMFPDFNSQQLLEMGTVSGAKALGLQDRVGSLAVGKDADLAVIPMESKGDWHEMFSSATEPIAVLSRGSFVVDNR